MLLLSLRLAGTQGGAFGGHAIGPLAGGSKRKCGVCAPCINPALAVLSNVATLGPAVVVAFALVAAHAAPPVGSALFTAGEGWDRARTVLMSSPKR